MSKYQENLLWDLMESEAFIKVYIDRSDGFKAEKPAIIVVGGIWNLPKKRGHHYTLWFGRFARWSFNSLKQAQIRIDEILSTATMSITPRIIKKR